MDSARLKQCAQKHLPEALDWLRQMVAINSFTTNVVGVNALSRLTVECFYSLGFSAQTIDSTHPDHASHLFLRRGPSKKKPLVLVTHLDTVFPPEEELKNNFRWHPEGERIYGPGTVDIKGGTMLIWLMLRVLKEMNPELFESTHWLIAANSAEEVIGSDFANATRSICPLGVRANLVFEGGPCDEKGWHIAVARKGRAEYRVTCHGRGAHAGGNFQQGINAIVELSKVLPQISDLSRKDCRLTVNVANIRGGTVLNRVPHEAVVELEMRCFNPRTLERTGQAVIDLAGPTEAGAEIVVECIGRTPSWPGGPDTDELFSHWEKRGQEMGLQVVPVRRGGLSDANYLCLLGPTLDALGPTGGNAHCSERSEDGSKLPEYVIPESFVTKTVLNLLAISDIPE